MRFVCYIAKTNKSVGFRAIDIKTKSCYYYTITPAKKEYLQLRYFYFSKKRMSAEILSQLCNLPNIKTYTMFKSVYNTEWPNNKFKEESLKDINKTRDFLYELEKDSNRFINSTVENNLEIVNFYYV